MRLPIGRRELATCRTCRLTNRSIGIWRRVAASLLRAVRVQLPLPVKCQDRPPPIIILGLDRRMFRTKAIPAFAGMRCTGAARSVYG
jgi:hypothetical protein